jgi:hypothetical protein
LSHSFFFSYFSGRISHFWTRTDLDLNPPT